MIIRDYNNETDLEGLRQCVISIQDYERDLEPRLPRGEDIVDEYVPDLFQRCRKYQGKILVADVEGSVAGYVMVLCRMVSDSIDDGGMEYGVVTDLVVLEDYRGKGYGSKLLAAAENEARENDVEWLRIGVLNANQLARDLYLARGFNPLAVELEKKLS